MESKHMLAVALTLVVLVSAALLLYQYWAGTLLGDDAEAAASDAAGITPDTLPVRHHLHIDNAA